MQLKFNVLEQHLQKTLYPVYLISTDDDCLKQEALCAILNKAKQEGFDEISRWHVNAQFDWNPLYDEANSLSLFSNKKILQVELIGKLGQSGSKTLRGFLETLHPDCLLIVSCGRLEASQRQSAWVKAIDKSGGVLIIWPLQRHEIQQWIVRQGKIFGMTLSSEGLRTLTNLTEGNLVACKQALQKLALAHGEGHINAEQVNDALSDSSQFELFDLSEQALLGNAIKTRQVLSRLKLQKTEPVLVLWILYQTLQQLKRLEAGQQAGNSLSQLFKIERIWPQKQAYYQQALQRHMNLSNSIQYAWEVELCLKGQQAGNLWDMLEVLALRLAGISLAITP